jgi:hypothetical protein
LIIFLLLVVVLEVTLVLFHVPVVEEERVA